MARSFEGILCASYRHFVDTNLVFLSLCYVNIAMKEFVLACC